MSEHRITSHPVLSPREGKEIRFTFDGQEMGAMEGEMISSALFANGIRIFGRHHRDGSPQGIFCANGQCAQCLVLADGLAVKSCITPLREGMRVMPMVGLPELPQDDEPFPSTPDIPEVEIEVFIMGAGPAGISAAIELAGKGVRVIIADDKSEPGGKLGLQTHNFFGSARECNAGVRGMDIGTMLTRKLLACETVEVWLNSPVVGVFSDRKIGVVRDGRFVLVRPRRFLVAAGAREKALAFPGCDLPGVYGAGAFQTMVNRDLVRAAERLFVVGGGNVGLIAAYHALQAGMDVLGIVEALPECGGYRVHLDKIRRLGVPVRTRHTVLRAEGTDRIQRVVICRIDDGFRPVPGTEAVFEVDTLLIAVGLSPVNEMLKKAKAYGMEVYAAGDADIIAEASAAIFGGKIVGRKILRDMGFESITPPEWEDMAETLRSKPGACHDLTEPDTGSGTIFPVIRCIQEIPCNPCSESCVPGSLSIRSESIMDPPSFSGYCAGCGRCVSICPGLAITLVDEGYDETREKALVILPWELPADMLRIGETRTTTGFEGEVIGTGTVIAVKDSEWQDRRWLVFLETPFGEARKVAGIRVREPGRESGREPGKEPDREPDRGPGREAGTEPGREPNTEPRPDPVTTVGDDDIIICRCERVTRKEIVDKIRDGCRDFNALKAELRIGMGPCGGKTCLDLIWRIFRECGVDPSEVEPHAYRPFELEVPLRAFLNVDREGSE